MPTMTTPAANVPRVDIAIIGAGPTGLSAACYAGFRGLSAAVLDSLEEPGGQISALYPEKLIHDIAGLPAVRGRDLVDSLLQQVEPFTPRYLLGQQVISLTRTSSGITVNTAAGPVTHCGVVLITAGIGTFTPRPLPAAADFGGGGLTYFVTSPDVLAGQDVLIAGGGDSALDWTLALADMARSVTLVHRRDTFRAHARTVDLVRASKARVVTGAQISALRGVDHVEGADIRHKNGTVESLAVQHVVAALGFTADLGPMRSWGLEIANRHIAVGSGMRTNLPGVYAAGDVTSYPGKVRLISVGFGEAATAVSNAAVYLDPTVDLFPGHSTDMDPALNQPVP